LNLAVPNQTPHGLDNLNRAKGFQKVGVSLKVGFRERHGIAGDDDRLHAPLRSHVGHFEAGPVAELRVSDHKI
jgi:hypothetical protein